MLNAARQLTAGGDQISMSQEHEIARDAVPVPVQHDGIDYLFSWHPPEHTPDGQRYGSSGLCLTDDGMMIAVSPDGEAWWPPGGRPEDGEDWHATLVREVREEACATVDSATLLGFVRGEAITGPRKGRTLVRSYWFARVQLHEWNPSYEILHRRVVDPDEILRVLDMRWGELPISRRWLAEARRVMTEQEK